MDLGFLILAVLLMIGLSFWLRSWKSGRRQRIDPRSALEHEKLVESIRFANKLVGDYGRILERNAHKDFKPETELPASKEAIKTAILLMAQYHKAAGALDEKLYGSLEIGYSMLADFVPDEVAARANRPLDVIRNLSISLAKGERVHLSDADISQLGSAFHSPEYESSKLLKDQTFAESSRLSSEFKEMVPPRPEWLPISDSDRRYAKIFLESNLITEDQVKEAIARQSSSGGTLSSNLVRLGHLTEEQVARFLAQQYSVPFIDLADQNIHPSVINLVPAEIAQKHKVIPVKRKENVLTLAMADPGNMFAFDDIRFLSGLHAEPVVATETSIKDAIGRHYHP
jgi:hypothetical protein